MNVLVLGSGGREDAICKKLKDSPLLTKLYAMPGNGGIKRWATLLEGSVMDKKAVLDACMKYYIDYVVVTPDDPLAIGMVDFLEEHNIKAFGPKKAAARIESSKAFAKDLMKKYSIPTARYKVFNDAAKALDYIKGENYPLVIKADGLALGKGVTIAKDYKEASLAIKEAMLDKKFGLSGDKIVVEEYLEGPEISVLAFTDGKVIYPMVSSMDHKRAYDGDVGPNTGGMGTIAPNPYYDEETAKECMERIFLPTIKAMAMEGCPFKGCLYFGLMKTKDGVKVIEYNSRFGDPESQVVLPLLESDLLSIMLLTTEGELKGKEIKFSPDAACCITLCSSGYPGSYEKGKEIKIDDSFDGILYIAGAKEENGNLITTGGRVLNVVEKAKTLKEAREMAYSNIAKVHFDGSFYRTDIGLKAIME